MRPSVSSVADGRPPERLISFTRSHRKLRIAVGADERERERALRRDASRHGEADLDTRSPEGWTQPVFQLTGESRGLLP